MSEMVAVLAAVPATIIALVALAVIISNGHQAATIAAAAALAANDAAHAAKDAAHAAADAAVAAKPQASPTTSRTVSTSW